VSYKQIREKTAWDIANTASVKATEGKVHKFGPWAKTWTGFRAKFQGLNLVHAWTITRNALAKPILAAATVPNWEARHSVQVHGYYTFGKEGATEEEFQDVIDDVTETFQHDFMLGGQQGDPQLLVPMTIAVPIIDHQPLGEVVCVHCRMDLGMRERSLIQGVA
jgi:hypothetical protein